MRRIVHVDHVGHAWLIRPDAAGVENTSVVLGVQHRLAGGGCGSAAAGSRNTDGWRALIVGARIAVGEVAVRQVDVGFAAASVWVMRLLCVKKVISTLSAEPT